MCINCIIVNAHELVKQIFNRNTSDERFNKKSRNEVQISHFPLTTAVKAALGRKVQVNRARKVTGEVEAQICRIACSNPPEGKTRWTMQMIADELIRLEVVEYITDSTVCETMKK